MMDTRRLWRHGREHLGAWLPAILMAFFALGSWWLVRSAPQFASPRALAPVTHDPDYQMRDFSVRNFNAEGHLTSELEGEQGFHYPDTDTLEVRQPRMRSWDEAGNPTRGKAERGVSNADGTEVKLYDNANIIRDAITAPNGHLTPRMEFHGNYLDVLTKLNRVQSDQRVDLLRGPDKFSGDRFDYDKASGIAHLGGNVHGLIMPADRK